MALYECICESCQFQFETRRSIKDDSPFSCPRCHGKARIHLVPVAVIYKGSGFYTTEHRGTSWNSSSSSESNSSAKTADAGASSNSPSSTSTTTGSSDNGGKAKEAA